MNTQKTPALQANQTSKLMHELSVVGSRYQTTYNTMITYYVLRTLRNVALSF